MEINSNGLSTDNVLQNLSNDMNEMKKSLGNDFAIKPEGVASNIITATNLMARDFEEQLAFLIKQFDPETAEGEYQDALYMRLNLSRKVQSPTTFLLTLTGQPKSSIEADILWVQNVDTGDLFFNSTGFTFDELGRADVIFESACEEDISLSSDSILTALVTEDLDVNFDFSTIKNITIGNLGESDSVFRERFHSIKEVNKKCTRNAILANLSDKTGGMQFVSIYDCNSDTDIAEGHVQIVARPTVSDAEFGKLILDNTIAGINFLGNTTVNVPLSNGQNWEVKFQKAKAIPIDLYIKTTIRQNYYENSIFHKVRNNILSYLESHVFGLKSTLWATEFIIPVLEIDGVASVTEIQIKRHDSQTYAGSIKLGRDEYPVFEYENVNLTK